MNILIINSGSSSLKFQCLDMDSKTTKCKGQIERIGLETGLITYKPGSGDALRKEEKITDHGAAMAIVLDLITGEEHGVLGYSDIEAVTHRFVHGGDKISKAEPITEDLIRIIKDNFDLAPLHNPPALKGFLAAKEHMPHIPHIGIFDTAFHSTIPPENYLYAIPGIYNEKYQIRKFGFHGASHKWAALKTAEYLGMPHEELNSVSIHIGGGVSAAAIRGGKSIDTSVGFGTNAGMSMGTRSGDLDTDVIFFMQENLGMTIPEIRELLYRKSGLLGLSEVSSDMRDVIAAAREGNKKAALAIGNFSHLARRYIAALSTNLEDRMDALVFTAGIGENSPFIREEICRGLGILGIRLDNDKNKAVKGETGVISSGDSSVKVLVIPTNEEMMMAIETRDVVLAMNNTGEAK
ncbi:MAG: acetate kinase [Spirochaetales bacterium]|nr:acetate kinase [Spirochaetales bacterium]